MNSTTSMSSPRTSSTPATSAQLVDDLAPCTMFAGLMRGIIPAVRQSSHAVRAMTTKNASGSQVVAKSAAAWNQCPTISASHRQRGTHPLAERCSRLLGCCEADAGLAPRGGAGSDPRLVDSARRVCDEGDAAPPAEQGADGSVVADVGRDAEEEDLVGVEHVEQGLGVRVREGVVLLLRDQDLAAPVEQAEEVGRG